MAGHPKWFVYILRCSDGTYYTGHTNNLEIRLKAHNAGKASKYTAPRRPVSLVYRESFASRSKAAKREYQIKKWTRAKKDALVSGEESNQG
jgi:predicted GIY-YIG superfamily endonuclease